MPTTSSSAGGEDLGRLALVDPAQHGPQQQAPAEDDGGDHADDLGHLEQHLARRVAGGVGTRCSTQQRQQCQDGNGRHVLEQQDGKPGLAAGCAHQVALGQGLQCDGGGRQRQAQRSHQAHAPGQAHQAGQHEEHRRAAQHLGAAHAEDGAAQCPQPAGLQLQPDEKEHQHHAELGKVQYVLHIAHQGQAPGPDGDAGRQITDDGAQAQGLGDGHGQYGGREVQEAVGEPGGCVFHGAGRAGGGLLCWGYAFPRRSHFGTAALCSVFGSAVGPYAVRADHG